jgi:hypothetical protein
MQLRARLAPFALSLVAACAAAAPASQDGGTEGGGAAGGAGAPAGQASIGADCQIDPPATTPLCAQISLCPGLVVERSAFPHCGFKAGGTTIDLQCACDGSLCPMGAVSSCAQAKALLEQTSEGLVCVGIDQGRCTGGPGRTTGGAGTCDQGCASGCGGDPGCLALCGC